MKPTAEMIPPTIVIDLHPYLSTRALMIGPVIKGTAIKRLPIQDVTLFEASNSFKNSIYKSPKEKLIPSAIIERIKEANTTTHPQPPSGIFGLSSWSAELSDEDDDEMEPVLNLTSLILSFISIGTTQLLGDRAGVESRDGATADSETMGALSF